MVEGTHRSSHPRTAQISRFTIAIPIVVARPPERRTDVIRMPGPLLGTIK